MRFSDIDHFTLLNGSASKSETWSLQERLDHIIVLNLKKWLILSERPFVVSVDLDRCLCAAPNGRSHRSPGAAVVPAIETLAAGGLVCRLASKSATTGGGRRIWPSMAAGSGMRDGLRSSVQSSSTPRQATRTRVALCATARVFPCTPGGCAARGEGFGPRRLLPPPGPVVPASDAESGADPALGADSGVACLYERVPRDRGTGATPTPLSAPHPGRVAETALLRPRSRDDSLACLL